MNMLSKNIRKFRHLKGLSQEYVADKLGYKSFTTIQKWESGISEPSITKLHELADLLDVDVNHLVDFPVEHDPYYLNPETAKLAQEAFEDPDTRILMSAKRTLSPESMQAVIDMVKLLRKKENPHLEDWPDDEYPDEINQDPENWD